MTGIEYEVLHVQDPILYVIRKQHRISPTQGWLQSQYHSIKYPYTKGWGFQMPKFLKEGMKLTGISRVEVGVSNQKTFHWWRKGVWIFSGTTHW